MKIIIIVILLFFSSSVLSVSDADPTLIYNCDAMADVWGCDPANWYNGDRLNCSSTTRNMNWATKPSRSSCYTVTAGDEASPATKYKPNENIRIHVRVHCLHKLYRGILIYAVNSTEQKVGEWEIPAHQPSFFSKPWESYDDTHPCKRTVMHATAEWKPLHSTLYFKAPAGTGRITFRCLIKYGNANTGDFYWPITDLSLTEAAPRPPSTLQWARSEVGQSCSALCAQYSGTCNQTALQSLTSENSIDLKIFPTNVCEYPYVSGSGLYGGSYVASEGLCYFIDPTCAAQSRAPSAVTCATSIPNIQRNCPCNLPIGSTTGTFGLTTGNTGNTGNTGATTGVADTGVTGGTGVTTGITGDTSTEGTGPVESGSSSRTPGLLYLLLLVPYLFSLNPRIAFAVLLVFGFASGHNWINSLSRSPGASTYRPCKPPLTAMPHAQVGPGQYFEIEWMNGHGDFVYFSVVHSRDSEKLSLHTPELMEDYILNAPVGNNVGQDSVRQKYHRKEENSLTLFRPNLAPIPNYFASVITSGPRYLGTRPPSFGGQIGILDTPAEVLAGPIYQMGYNYTQIQYDRIVNYTNSNYPWIEAVYKFQITSLHPRQPDVARFFMPARGGDGRYIVHWMWRGYRDCVDVDVKSTPVANIYGTPSNISMWTRIDHCFFDTPQNVFAISEVFTDAQDCLNKCASNGNCNGINLVPIMAPSSVYPNFTESAGEIWMYPQYYGSDIYVPWNHTRFDATRDSFIAKASPENYLCYGVKPKEFTDTEDEYSVTSDPEHPTFYSTCYYKFEGNIFPEYLNGTNSESTLSKIPWRFFDECIDCTTQAYNSVPEAGPRWKVADTCINCDIEPANLTSLYPPSVFIEAGVRCDGLGGTWKNTTHHNCTGNDDLNCVKPLIPIGRTATSDITLDECRLMTEEDPECSSIFMIKQVTPFRCFCYTKQTCCKVCTRSIDANYNTYEVTSVPDPTCANGVLSSGNTGCCSRECGAGNCVTNPGNGSKPPVGFCCSNCSARPCSQYGAPCTM